MLWKCIEVMQELVWCYCARCAFWRTVMNIRGWRQLGSTPYDLFSWNKHDLNIYIINDLIKFEYIDKGFLKMLTLCTLCPLCHAWLFFPSSSCYMLPPSLLGLECLSRPLSGLAPLPWADPVSPRSWTTPYPFVGHSYDQNMRTHEE